MAPTKTWRNIRVTFEADCALLEEEGVDLLFAPSVEEMYPPGAATWVEVEDEGRRLEGASRPGHLRGVATVVSKLFHIVAPTKAFFGQKDAAQLAILRKMVRDLNFDLQIVGCPIVREPDGLAMSSRNRYLSAEERKQALVLSRALRSASDLAASGETSSAPLVATMRAEFAAEPGARVDYITVVDPDTLYPWKTLSTEQCSRSRHISAQRACSITCSSDDPQIATLRETARKAEGLRLCYKNLLIGRLARRWDELLRHGMAAMAGAAIHSHIAARR